MQISAANLLVASQQPRTAAAAKPAAFTPANFETEAKQSQPPASPPVGAPGAGYAPAARPGSQLDIRV